MKYDVYLIAQANENYEKDNVKMIALKKPANRLIRFVVTDSVLLIKAIRLNAQLYHFHDPELIITGILLRFFGKKVIYDVHEDIIVNLKDKPWLKLKGLSVFVYTILEKIAKRISVYFVLAEKSYLGNYKDVEAQSVIIQNFVPVQEVQKYPDLFNKSGNIFALVGYLSARRGLPFIIEAMDILKRKGFIVYLRCIGEVNDDVSRILRHSEHWHAVKDQVDFSGYIPFPDYISQLKDCIAGFALPENLPNHFNSYPTKMFEYMAAGLPVIASDFELYKDVIQNFECGINVNPENSNEIAGAMEFLIRNPEMAERFSNHASVAVKNFDWNTEQQKLLKFYSDILH